MIYTTYAYGHDFGNSETCGALSPPVGTSHVLTLPSALSPGTYDDLIQKVNGSSATGNLLSILNDKAHTIEVRGKHWYVGELAIDQAPPNIKIADLTARGDISRYWSDRNLAFLLTTSGTLIADREYGLTIVTNLPIATHNEANVQQVKATLSGDHTFVLDGRSRIAHIRVMKTIMEGAGAAIAYGPGGQTKVGIIDIGGRTTDIYLVKGQLPIQEQCGSLDVGVESASDAIVTAFERRFAYPLSPSDARALLFCYTRGKDYQAIATVMNAELDSSSIDQLIREQLRETGQKMLTSSNARGPVR